MSANNEAESHRSGQDGPQGDKSPADQGRDLALQGLLESVPEPHDFVELVLEHVPESHLLKTYLTDISRMESLSADEEAKLFASLRKGGVEAARARKKLNEAHMRLVVWIAKEYTEGGAIQIIDLINEGAIGLMQAVDTFDSGSSFDFAGYAIENIRRSVAEALSEETRLSRVPAYLLDKVKSIKGVTRNLAEELGREPSRAEVADALGLDAEELERLVELVKLAPEKEEGEDDADQMEPPAEENED